MYFSIVEIRGMLFSVFLFILPFLFRRVSRVQKRLCLFYKIYTMRKY